jgi:ABC-2 type transport system permease protein
MNKTVIIILREYLTRVRKKSFIIMSILGPLFFAGMMIAPTLMTQMEESEPQLIAVVDSSQMFIGKFRDTKYIKFEYMPDANINKYKNTFYDSKYSSLLYISQVVANSPNAVFLYSDKSVGLGVQTYISGAIEKILEKEKLKVLGVKENTLRVIKTDIDIKTMKLSKKGDEQESNYTLAMILGYLSGFLIYFAIFFSGAQVMRGIVEEKTNRIIEIIISSVKPFQLMMGKIIGVGLVALTQFLIWGVLTITIYTIATPMLMPDYKEANSEVPVVSLMDTGNITNVQLPDNKEMLSELVSMMGVLNNINFAVIISSFIFFFFGGYFFYGAIFAAIGSAVDSEADTHQFMMPVTLPLILGVFVMIHTIQNPESSLSYWFSIIPFTSPIVMMARIPFGVPYSDIILSAVILIISFVVFTKIAAKIYRTGILMYGKKASWKEMIKWIKYR